MSKKYSFNQDDMTKLLKVALYSSGAAFIGAFLTALPQIDIPGQYMFIVPVINTLMVAFKKFLQDRA